MSATQLRLVFAGALGLTVFSTAQGQPTMQVTWNFSDPFLQANNLMSVTIRVVGFQDGQSIQGFHGPFEYPWNVGALGTQFFNIDSVVDPNDPKAFLFEDGFYAAPNNPTLNALTGGAARWDSGLLGNPATLGSPADDDPDDTAGGFAFFADGSSDLNVAHATWISLQPNGVPVNSSTQWPVMRLTWPIGSPMTASFLLLMNTPPGDVPLGFSVPFEAIGACCLSADSCGISTEYSCLSFHGVYQGNFVECGVTPCPEPCPGNLNDDLQVNVEDLLMLIGAWGVADFMSPPDLVRDGVVNVLDLLALISHWGACP